MKNQTRFALAALLVVTSSLLTACSDNNGGKKSGKKSGSTDYTTNAVVSGEMVGHWELSHTRSRVGSVYTSIVNNDSYVLLAIQVDGQVVIERFERGGETVKRLTLGQAKMQDASTAVVNLSTSFVDDMLGGRSSLVEVMSNRPQVSIALLGQHPFVIKTEIVGLQKLKDSRGYALLETEQILQDVADKMSTLIKLDPKMLEKARVQRIANRK